LGLKNGVGVYPGFKGAKNFPLGAKTGPRSFGDGSAGKRGIMGGAPPNILPLFGAPRNTLKKGKVWVAQR